jgi:phage shock protein A
MAMEREEARLRSQVEERRNLTQQADQHRKAAAEVEAAVAELRTGHAPLAERQKVLVSQLEALRAQHEQEEGDAQQRVRSRQSFDRSFVFCSAKWQFRTSISFGNGIMLANCAQACSAHVHRYVSCDGRVADTVTTSTWSKIRCTVQATALHNAAESIRSALAAVLSYVSARTEERAAEARQREDELKQTLAACEAETSRLNGKLRKAHDGLVLLDEVTGCASAGICVGCAWPPTDLVADWLRLRHPFCSDCSWVQRP